MSSKIGRFNRHPGDQKEEASGGHGTWGSLGCGSCNSLLGDDSVAQLLLQVSKEQEGEKQAGAWVPSPSVCFSIIQLPTMFICFMNML